MRELLNKTDFYRKMTWYNKIFFWVSIGIFGIVICIMIPAIRHSINEKQTAKNKLKYFKPTLYESFWGNKIKWEQRDVPLTDEQIKALG